MGDFRSFRSARRAPAQALEPIIDGTAWSPESLRDVERWSYRLSAQDCAELVGAAEAARGGGTALEEVSREGPGVMKVKAWGSTFKCAFNGFSEDKVLRLSAALWQFDADGLIERVDFHIDREAALRSLGNLDT